MVRAHLSHCREASVTAGAHVCGQVVQHIDAVAESGRVDHSATGVFERSVSEPAAIFLSALKQDHPLFRRAG
jgi:hypothetical protein